MSPQSNDDSVTPASPRSGRAASRRRAKVWLDGAIVDADQASVPVTDHGLLYGDGIFEGIRVFAGRVFRLDDHLARFAVSAKGIGLTLPGGLAQSNFFRNSRT